MLEGFAGRDVLITGAGGFIGSSLARALAGSLLRSLVLLDSSEQRLVDLGLVSPAVRLVLGSVEDDSLLRAIFSDLERPTVIHAAAHKHVAFLEAQPIAAVRNNTLATYALAQTAREYGAARFVFLSTDKAVRPHSVMGASKRAAELLILPLAGGGFEVSALRLGNVLGSTGSVVPLFAERIAQGLPLAITDEHAARFFFPVEDTIRFILTAALSNSSGVVLVPANGQLTRVVDLARQLYPNAELQFTGLRPGEKLEEQFAGPDEEAIHEMLDSMIAFTSRGIGGSDVEQVSIRLRQLVNDRDIGGLLRTLCELVPEYVPSDLVSNLAGTS